MTSRFSFSDRVRSTISPRFPLSMTVVDAEESVRKLADHGRYTEVEHEQSAHQQIWCRDEVDRDLRRQLVDETDRDLEHQPIQDKGAGQPKHDVSGCLQGVCKGNQR